VERESFQVEAIGEIEMEDRVLIIKRITVRYRLAVAADQREEAERVHGFHARFCPVARSLEGGIEVRTELELV
jgi:organic hydroperoxide reductase OsmC/OhrA